MTTPITPPPDPGRTSTVAPPPYTVRTPEDLLAVVPVLLGFEPEESVTVLTLGARGGATDDRERGFHARVDLPSSDVGDEALDAELDAMVESLVEPVARHRVGRVVVLVHSTRRATAGLAGDRLVQALADRAPETEVIEALHADGRRWWPLLPDRATREGSGVPYDVRHHPLRLRAVVDGRVTHPSRAALAATLDDDGEGRARLEELWARRGPRRPAADAAEEAWVAAVVAEALAGGRVLHDAAALRLLLAVRDGRCRDAACRTLTRDRAVDHVALWRDLVRRSPEELRAAPAALLGLAAWVSGDGALAWCALDRCAEVEPSHGLAVLVATALQRAVPPSAWEESVGAAPGPRLDSA